MTATSQRTALISSQGSRSQEATAFVQSGLSYWAKADLWDDPEDREPHGDRTLFERSIQDYDETIRLNPEYAYAYKNRGLAYEIIGKQIEAERDYATAKELGFEGP